MNRKRYLGSNKKQELAPPFRVSKHSTRYTVALPPTVPSLSLSNFEDNNKNQPKAPDPNLIHPTQPIPTYTHKGFEKGERKTRKTKRRSGRLNQTAEIPNSLHRERYALLGRRISRNLDHRRLLADHRDWDRGSHRQLGSRRQEDLHTLGCPAGVADLRLCWIATVAVLRVVCQSGSMVMMLKRARDSKVIERETAS